MTRFAVATALALLASPAAASSLLIASNNTCHAYGCETWATVTGLLDGAFDVVTVVDDFTDLDEMLTYDALWLDQRGPWGPVPSTLELINISAFANTGRRIVMIGENENWAAWDTAILSVVGGTLVGSTDGYPARVEDHALTAGVNALYVAAGGIASGGGVSLFAENVVTVWDGNVVTILDTNIFEDPYLPLADNLAFTQNVVTWLATPEPSTALLLAAGLAALATARRYPTRN